MPTIDADTHVIESAHTWDYLEDPQFRPRAVTMQDSQGVTRQYWQIDGRLRGRGEGEATISPAIREMDDLEGRLRRMDALHIDVQVLFPTLFLAPITIRPEVDVALCRSYNRWLADVCQRGGTRFRWVLMPPLLDMPSALAELEFGAANGARGVVLRGIEGNRQLTDPYFYPLYERAAALNLPICIHSGNGNMAVFELLTDSESNNRYFSSITPVLGAFVGIVTNALPERFPTLRIGFIEAGSQWLPYLVREAARRHETIATQGLIEDESTALRSKRIYVACRTDDDLPYVMRWSGENNLIIGTDFGHVDPAAELDALTTLRQRGAVTRKILDKILGDNACAFYGI